MAFTLPPLPYAFNAMEPHIDAQTMEIHHGKHHQAYVTNLNKALDSRRQTDGGSKQWWWTLEPFVLLANHRLECGWKALRRLACRYRSDFWKL